MTKPLLAILLLLTLVAASVRAGMIDDKGSWSSLNYAHQTGCVLAAIDSHYYFFSKDTSEEEETEKAQVRVCIADMDSSDFINIINTRYEDLQNYRKPPYKQLREGLKEVCNVEGQ